MNRLRRLAGQVIMTGIPGPVLDGDTTAALRALGPSGVILFRRNVESVEQLRGLTAALHEIPSRPLVSIDHEGGRVTRLGAPFTQFPPAREIGRTGDPDLAYAVGLAMGTELASVGIDINFAPVLDVDSNPDNPIIGDRAFSNRPEEVATFAIAFLRGLQAGGVLPCGKHFPGHGDTDRDSHTELPVAMRSRAALDSTELLPFRAAIAVGVPLLMTAHVVYPALDPHQPATLSRRTLQNLLRQEMGFAGVVVSDDLGMRAISAHWSIPEGAVAALQSGVDWVLICNDLAESRRTAERIATALAHGELSEAPLVAAAERIQRLRAPAPRVSSITLPVPEHEALNARIRTAAAHATGVG